MERFFHFRDLPKNVRLEIWKFAASVPRVVSAFEAHDFDFDMSAPVYETVMISRTRPPAMLSVCQESRLTGLEIYKAMDEGIRTKGGSFGAQVEIPIYVNPEVDTVLRGKKACRKGDAFRHRVNKWIMESKPFDATRSLAVDLVALTRRNDDTFTSVLREWRDDPVGLIDGGSDVTDKLLSVTPVPQIAACAAKGLRELIVVVGNDDDASEVIFVPLDTDQAQWTPRVKGAMQMADRLRKDLVRYLATSKDESLSAVSPPAVSVMTIKKAPVASFPQFQKLPAELQDMVWRHALRTPKVITLTNKEDEEGIYLTAPRRTSVVEVCRASRHIGTKEEKYCLLPGPGLGLFNPDAETVRMDINTGRSYKDYAKYGIESLGIMGWYSNKFTGQDAKLFRGLREIVLVLGRPVAEYEMELVDVPQYGPVNTSPGSFHEPKLVETAYNHIRRLRRELDKTSRKWKAYQKRREKQGKSSPDWIVPTVRLARMVPIYATVSPYLYEHRVV